MKIFVSYSGRDLEWAKWLVWELENAKQRYQCIVQFRDFAPGMSFTQKMREAANSEFTLALFSSTYLKSQYCQDELNAALVRANTLLPVKVVDCELGPFLANRIYIDLTGGGIDAAREALLAGVEAFVTQTLLGKPGRKMRTRPNFPGADSQLPPPAPALQPQSFGPLRVLFMGPVVGGLNPKGQFDAMRKAAARGRYKNSIRMRGVFQANIGRLFDELNHDAPDVFHFSGKQNGGDILMKAEDGSLTSVTDLALAGTFRSLGHGLKLVIIDTCYSLRCATTITKAVPFAIGVEGDPYEDDTVAFYKVFYQALASGRSLADAVHQARSALSLGKVSQKAIPQLCHAPGLNPATTILVSG